MDLFETPLAFFMLYFTWPSIFKCFEILLPLQDNPSSSFFVIILELNPILPGLFWVSEPGGGAQMPPL